MHCHCSRNYLGILKNVHSGADLQASAAAAGNRCARIQLTQLGTLSAYDVICCV